MRQKLLSLFTPGPGRLLVVALMAGLVFAATAIAAAGDLDLSFSGDGKQTTNFGAVNDGANGVAVQSDGKIVAVGNTGSDFALARYNPNGSLDPTFSGDGRQTTDFAAAYGAKAVAIQPDGKIVAVGRAGGGGLGTVRYNPNGSLDPTFSGDGKQIAHGGSGEANAVALQANGKIVVAGSGGGFGVRSGAFVVARLNPNGSLDTSFSGDGVQSVFGGHAEARGVAVQSDGKVIAAGFAGGANFAIARLNTNGALDPTFSGDGKQTTNFSRSSDFANGVALQANGKIVAAGSTLTSDFAWALARYNPNGTLDTSFSGDGKQTTPFGGFGIARAVKVQGDGKIVAAGISAVGDRHTNNFAVARYNTNGTLDTSFSGDGRQATNFGDQDEANAVALQADGKIVAAGVRFATDGSSDFALARYLGN
jgi:uncharacterized delta-60 repeat protein